MVTKRQAIIPVDDEPTQAATIAITPAEVGTVLAATAGKLMSLTMVTAPTAPGIGGGDRCLTLLDSPSSLGWPREVLNFDAFTNSWRGFASAGSGIAFSELVLGACPAGSAWSIETV